MNINNKLNVQPILTSTNVHHQPNSYTLYIDQLKVLDQINQANIYVRISDQMLNQQGQSPLFLPKMIQGRNFIVNSSSPQIQLCSYCDGNREQEKYLFPIGSSILNEKNNEVYITNPDNKNICLLKYAIKNTNNKEGKIKQNVISDAKDSQAEQIWEDNSNSMGAEESNNEIVKQPENQRQTEQSEQITKIKIEEAQKVVDESIKKSEQQRLMFTKYLQESNNLIQELLIQINTKPKQKQLSIDDEDEQNDELECVRKKPIRINGKIWSRRKKYQKDGEKQVSKNINNESTEIEEYQNRSEYKQFTQVMIDCKTKIKQIKLYAKKKNRQKQQTKLTIQSGKFTNARKAKFSIISGKSIEVKCLTLNKQQITGLIGKSEEKKGQCLLYDGRGNVKGVLHFNCKNRSSSPSKATQTPQISDSLQQNLISKKSKNKKAKLSQNSEFSFFKTSKRNQLKQSHQSSQQISIIDELKQSYHSELHFDEQSKKCNALPICQKKRLKDLYKKPLNKRIESSVSVNNQNRSPSSTCEELEELKKNELPREAIHKGLINSEKLKKRCKSQKIAKQQCMIGQQQTKSPRNQLFEPNQLNKQQKNSNQQPNRELNPQIKLQKRKIDYTDANNKDSEDIVRREQEINIKISQIILKQHSSSSTNRKFIKIYLNNHSIPYCTQSLQPSSVYCWTNKNYFFLKMSQWTVLHLQLVEQNKKQSITKGVCKIYILSLLKNKSNYVTKYSDHIYNQNQQPIAQIKVGYEFISKNTKSFKGFNSHFRTKKNYQLVKNRKLCQKDEINTKQKTESKPIEKLNISNSLRKSGKILPSSTTKNQSPNSFQPHRYSCQRNYKKFPTSRYTGKATTIPKSQRFSNKELFFNPILHNQIEAISSEKNNSAS